MRHPGSIASFRKAGYGQCIGWDERNVQTLQLYLRTATKLHGTLSGRQADIHRLPSRKDRPLFTKRFCIIEHVAASRAASAPHIRRLPLPARDFYPAVGLFVHSQWQSSWDAQSRNKLRELKSTLEPWQYSLRESRRQEVVLCRLRVGHTYGTHGYLLRGEERPMCLVCNVPVTVAHILLTCQRYARKRTSHLGRIHSSATLKHLLGDDSPWAQDNSIFSFIRDIDFPVIYPFS